MSAEQWVREQLLAMADEGYKSFQCKLIPNITSDTVIGVRAPQLRALARETIKSGRAEAFMSRLPHRYYEENNLHACLISQLGDYSAVLGELDRFLPHIDNWATCDMLRPRVFAGHPEDLPDHIRRWMAHGHPYTVRFGMEMLMLHYLDEAFRPEYLSWVAGAQREEYYVRMMVAWFFATALAKQYDKAVVFLQEHRLALWTHNKTIQKAVESFRISDEQKKYLRTLRRRE